MQTKLHLRTPSRAAKLSDILTNVSISSVLVLRDCPFNVQSRVLLRPYNYWRKMKTAERSLTDEELNQLGDLELVIIDTLDRIKQSGGRIFIAQTPGIRPNSHPVMGWEIPNHPNMFLTSTGQFGHDTKRETLRRRAILLLENTEAFVRNPTYVDWLLRDLKTM